MKLFYKQFKDWMFSSYEITEEEFDKLSPGLQNYIGYLEFIKDGFFFYTILGIILIIFYYLL